MITAIKSLLRKGFEQLDRVGERLFGARHNPFTHLGALGWFLFWIIAVSGIYVYIFFDTGVTQAYESLEAMARQQPLLGGVMRSWHRYASDALVVMVVVHLLREFALDRMRGNRWFPWVTGVLLLWFVYACGITGYWLVWDQLSQYVAITTSEWLDALGIFAEPIARNFLSNTQLSGRFFTLMVYIHIAVPLLMLLFMWVHIQRHAHARVTPSRPLMAATLVMLLVLALWLPARSQAPANLDRMPFEVGLDWFYLALYPLLETVNGKTLWAAVGLGTALLAALAWVPPLRKPAAAQVHLDQCNGCSRCFADCPFGAITMLARSDGLPFEQEARVEPDQCVSCGICVGSCPTATPFRRATALVPGIELPHEPLAQLRERIVAAGAALSGYERVIVFGCAHAGDTAALASASVAVIPLPCIGMLPPSFIDFVLSRKHAEGVFIAGCAEDGCYQRLGDRWTFDRIAAQRDPQLRARIARERVALSRESCADAQRRAAALKAFRELLPGASAANKPGTGALPWLGPDRSWPAPVRWTGQALLGAGLAAIIGFLATQPGFGWLGRDEATVKLSFSHASQPLKPCRRYTPDELARLPFEKRTATTCERGRWPVVLELDVDGRTQHRGVYRAAGLWDDGPSTVYVRFALPAGTHRFEARLRDTGRREGFDYQGSMTATLARGQNFVVDFRAAEGGFRFAGKAGERP